MDGHYSAFQQLNFAFIDAGVSIKAGYQRSTAVCLDFINENKNDIKKNPVLWSIKIPINSTLFDAQNAGNRISELLYFKFF